MKRFAVVLAFLLSGCAIHESSGFTVGPMPPLMPAIVISPECFRDLMVGKSFICQTQEAE